ncbi:family 2A encapsulin nanocompartment cargo protein cysteine desulfurase [Comamonas sp. GB3 AK4-5]|uniref:family 2A encapsulin nanocompartment cargo protein cysteine desulfurase n=1 Tax=Comamonas sp. GB3 AK4-5 TaxID=3231487 RepID=UPI00351DB0CB
MTSTTAQPTLPAAPQGLHSSPIDTAALAQLASAFFRALPGEAASPAGPQSSAGSAAAPALPAPSSAGTRSTRLPLGVQPPSNPAPPGSPLASPVGLSPNLPGTPLPLGQAPGSNLLPSHPSEVLALANRVPTGQPKATAGNGVPDVAHTALPAYEPQLLSLAAGVPQAHAATAQSAVQPPSDSSAPPVSASPASPPTASPISSPYYFANPQSSERPSTTGLDALSSQALAALVGQPPGVPPLHAPGLPGNRSPSGAPAASPTAPQFYFVDAVQLPGGHVTPATAGARVPALDGAGDRHPAFDVQAVRRDFPILQERIHGKQLVWLDNAATTHKPRQVIERLRQFYEHENSNIHRAAHALAARATDAYEHAREVVRRFINAPDVNEVIFVRGTTEAINLVAQSWGGQNVGTGDEVIVSHLEHHANIVPWQQLAAAKGAKLRVIPVDDQGQILLEEYQKLINERTKIVAITHVSNVLGTVVPVKQVVDIAKRHGIVTLVDGAQSIAHTPVDVQDIGADFFVFSGHKIFAPTGIGALWGRRALLEAMPPWQGGGNMIADVTFEKTVFQPLPNRFEAGTGNIADAVGLGAALEYVERIGIDNISRYEHALVDYGMQQLAQIPGLRLIGTVPGKASVLSFTLEGYTTDEVGKALNAEGIAVRTGHHCAQPILRRYGVESAVRPSLAFYNTFEEVDLLVSIVRGLAGQRR